MSETTRLVTRLHPEEFKKLRDKCGGTHVCRVTPETTPQQAGFLLGVQHVLNLLSEGFTTAEA